MSGDFRESLPPNARQAVALRPGQDLVAYAYAAPMPQVLHQTAPPNALREVLRTLLRFWKLIAACALTALLLAPVVLYFVAPVYQADALLQVEAGNKTVAQPVAGEIAGITGEIAPVSAEIELLKSRLILGSVIDQMRLDLVAQPRRLPVIGNWLAGQPGLRDALGVVGLLPQGYGWGDERIEIGQFELPLALMGRPLIVTGGSAGSYTLFDQERLLLSGTVGTLATATLPEGDIRLMVAALEGEIGTPFDVTLSSRADTVQGLLKNFRATEQGKDSGLIRVTYRGSDPARISEVINISTREYQAQDVQWRTAKASRKLDFLNSQLPQLKLKVEQAEAALARLKRNNRAPDLTTETALLLQQSVTAEQDLQRLRQQWEGLQQQYTDAHPSVLAVNAQIAQASSTKLQLDGRIRTLPGSQRETATLTRDLEVNMRLFVTMLDESQQLAVAKFGTLGTVRIVDEAVVPSQPVFPRPGIVLAAALIAGLVGGGFLASLLMAARSRVETVADLEDAAGPCCIAAIRHSPNQHALQRRSSTREGARRASVLGLHHPRDPALAGIRRLRAAILTDQLTAEGGVILLGGIDAGVGRSFVLANLAVALMGSSQRIVVLDADLEGRGMQRYFTSHRAGVSDWLTHRSRQIDELIETGMDGQPDYICAGGVHSASSGSLPPAGLRALLGELRGRYDYVLVNAPPLSLFADGLVVAKAVDAVVLIGSQFRHRASEVTDISNRLVRAGVPVIGVVLNQMRSSDRLGYLGSTALA